MNDLIKKLNTSFLHLEDFINGVENKYNYFGFYWYIMSEFCEECLKPENINKTNYKLLRHYNNLCEQFAINLRNKDFINKNVFLDMDFCKECEDITDILGQGTLSKVADFQKAEMAKRKYSIRDIINNELTKENYRKKSYINNTELIEKLFKDKKSYKKLIYSLTNEGFIIKNNDATFIWKGAINETGLKSKKLLCVLGIVLKNKNHLIPNLTDTKISSALTNTFNIKVTNTYFGQVRKEYINKANDKILDYKSAFYFIKTV